VVGRSGIAARLSIPRSTTRAFGTATCRPSGVRSVVECSLIASTVPSHSPVEV
jgi:hypothetical protein